MSISCPWTSVLVLGAMAGLRAFSAPAVLADRLPAGSGSPLSNVNVARAARVFAVGERIADKLPGIGPRTAPASLAARLLSGAFAGATIAHEKGRSGLAGGLLGGGTAVGAAFAGYHLRRLVDAESGLPDAVVAVGEDAMVWGLSTLV
jgi:uncharacterized membrane protein